MKPINVGLLGIGTVGGGTWDVLKRNASEIQRRAGRAIRITRVADQAVARARKITDGKAQIHSDAFEVVRAKDIDIVVELIGGYTIAKQLVLEAIRNGKHVVTANKALLATHGNEIFKAAQKQGVMVAFEASVGGGIPTSTSSASWSAASTPRVATCSTRSPTASMSSPPTRRCWRGTAPRSSPPRASAA